MIGIFLDQETTGLDSRRHRLLEFACKIVNLNTGDVIEKYEAIVKQPIEVWEAKDPTSILVNGFTWEEINQGKTEEKVAEDICSLFRKTSILRGKALFICQNPSFDRMFFAQLINPYQQEELLWPYHWLDLASMYWAFQVKRLTDLKQLLPDEMKVSKDRIAAAYRLAPEKQPHRAMNGVDHLLLCYRYVVGFPQLKIKEHE